MGNGLKWATCNVGATNPQGYGGYYAWGETTTKTTYSFDTYKWFKNNSITKYTTLGATLESADDAPRANWGGTWRMPTPAEWTWLRTNCTWAWQNNYNGTGVKGMLVTSKISGYTSNSIFLPAAGYRYESDLYGVGDEGNYWSSSLNNKDVITTAEYLRFNLYSQYNNAFKGRNFGCSVRPVSN